MEPPALQLHASTAAPRLCWGSNGSPWKVLSASFATAHTSRVDLEGGLAMWTRLGAAMGLTGTLFGRATKCLLSAQLRFPREKGFEKPVSRTHIPSMDSVPAHVPRPRGSHRPMGH